jgi:hypothetical protein
MKKTILNLYEKNTANHSHENESASNDNQDQSNLQASTEK